MHGGPSGAGFGNAADTRSLAAFEPEFRDEA